MTFTFDTALVESFSRSEEDEAFSLLNRDLQKLDEWSHTWNMNFNAQKSVYTIITNKRNQKQKPVLMMNNVILENVEYHKHFTWVLTFLGIYHGMNIYPANT